MKKDLIKNITDIENIIEENFSDLEAEEVVISYLIRKNYKVIKNIEENYFVNNSFQFFSEMIRKYNSCFIKKMFLEIVEKESNKRDLEKNLFYLHKIYKLNLKEIKKNNIQPLIEKIKKKYQARKTMGAVQKIIEMVDDFDAKEARRILSPIYNLNKDETDNVKEVLDDFEDIYREVQEKPKRNVLIKTGISKIDKLIGGVQKTEFALIAAETGLGKSIFLGNIAINAWKAGKNVVFFSLEMSVEQTMLRIYSNISNIFYNNFRMGNLNERENERWISSIEEYRKERDNFLYVISKPRGTNCIDIEEQCYDIQDSKEKKIDLIIIDYLNIMDANRTIKGQAGKEHSVQAEISWNLKQLAGGFNNEGVVVWSAAQIKDEAYGKVIGKGSIKYSRGITENCPLIFGLAKTEDDTFTDTLTMSVVKIRDGANIKPFQIIPVFDYMRFDTTDQNKKDFLKR